MAAMLPAADRCGFGPAAQAVRRRFGIAGRAGDPAGIGSASTFAALAFERTAAYGLALDEAFVEQVVDGLLLPACT
jgi:hypothetical protein